MSHFKILYRQFLFRLMDIEFLAASARGDASVLVGQFASMLIFLSLFACYPALIVGNEPRSPIFLWLSERLLIEATMLVVGIFALLSWDSTFPDRRDVQILVPLPVKARELFTAKIAAAASALGLTILALDGLCGIAWPLALFTAGGHHDSVLRLIAAYWITMPAAGLFLYCAILGVQGLAAQLPRGWFLRLSSFLQLAAFALFLGVLFLQPSFITEQSLAAPENQLALAWLPPYWFLGLFNSISGAHPSHAMDALAGRAVVNLAIAIALAAAAFILSWLRTLRKIAEEPDILPGSRGGLWLPSLGNQPRTALVQFIVRTLARSRQHRMNLAFYLGVGCAMAAASIQSAPVRQPMNASLLISILVILIASIVGVRISFSRPLDLRANWLYRVAPVQGGIPCLSATRCALLALSAIPVWIASTAILLHYWPWQAVAKHAVLLALFALLLTEASLIGFHKIPFTCSYLPGKSKVHIVFVTCLLMLPMMLVGCIEAEQWIVSDNHRYVAAIVTLIAATLAIRKTNQPQEDIQYEEFAADEIISLGL